MMLTALTQYYDRLAQKGDKVPSFGFSEEKVGYILVLSEAGELLAVRPHLTSDKKPKPRLMNVPRPEKRTSGIKPNFLWDKTAYVLGVSLPKDKKSEAVFELATPAFEAFRDTHLSLLNETEDTGLRAVVQFLTSWEPEKFAESILEPEILDANLVFHLDGVRQYVHESTEAKAIWAEQIKPKDTKEEMCLITGKKSSISRLHPAIKGVSGGQSSGVSIVSFNKQSFESFGKEQGENAPVSEEAAFAYTTALNYLLRRENNQVISLGDTSVVFWALADTPEKAEKAEGFFKLSFNPPSMATTTDEAESKTLFADLERLSKGRPLTEIAPDLDPKTQFFILGLAPNAARLSIRFWLQTDLGQIRQRFAEHFQDLALDPLPWKTPPSVWRLLLQLVPHREGQQPKIDDAPAHLAGELMRSILTGQRYPRAILSQLLARFRADGDISDLRIALGKAVLQRDFRQGFITEEIPMSLDESSTDTAYLLGRLFALLENIQYVALDGKINAGIADKYFASASTVPYSVFPRLVSGSKHHISKIKKTKKGKAIFYDQQLDLIFENLPLDLPRHFSIEKQYRFSLGYHQQRKEIFKRTEKEVLETENTTGAE